jgi:hypothetical protein
VNAKFQTGQNRVSPKVAKRHQKPELLTKSGESVPEGTVELRVHGDGGQWVLVAIGRRRSAKRFNITRAELAVLVDTARREGLVTE